MQPLVRDGDILLVSPANGQNIRPGDAVLFINQFGRAVLHRVIRKKRQEGKWFFWLQGDQAATIDGIIPQEQILGKLTSLERNHITIAMGEPGLRLLNVLMALRSRLRMVNRQPNSHFSSIISRLFIFNKYLS